MTDKHYTLARLATLLCADLKGDPDTVVSGIGPLVSATAGQLSFLDNPKYRKHLAQTEASAVIVAPIDAESCPVNALIMDKPYVGFARAAGLFASLPVPVVGIHPQAVIGHQCQIDETASIGPYCVVGDNVTIGSGTVLSAGCHVGDGSQIGNDCHLWPHVTLYYRVKLGQRVVIHSGAVIGSDGFGMANDQGKWVKIPQLGGVQIGNDVEIGANTTIDRGALGDTIIDEGVKLDNQIQIGHNVHIGAHTAIAGGVGISGSVVIGRHCVIAGKAAFAGHITVADGTIITGMTSVTKSITEPGIYSSGTVVEPNRSWKKNAVRFRHLDTLFRRIEDLEQQLRELQHE